MTHVLLTNLFGNSPDIAIVREAPDGETAIDMARELLPDAVIMDAGMPHMSGIDASRIVHFEHPEIQVIALSMFDETEMGSKIKDAGAAGGFNRISLFS
jgi:DNA-binding NarL/FixJ family response regulator